jgi:hypothetical protein
MVALCFVFATDDLDERLRHPQTERHYTRVIGEFDKQRVKIRCAALRNHTNCADRPAECPSPRKMRGSISARAVHEEI